MEGSRGWLRQRVGKLRSLFPSHRPGLLERERERSFIENGSKLLEELITSCKDKCRCNPIRIFSAKHVLEATNHFQSHCIDDYCKWYKGTLDDRPVLIKTYPYKWYKETLDHRLNTCYYDRRSEPCRDIAVSSQMSSHRNALKLLGCCLELSRPALVYEDVENGPLCDMYGFISLSPSWNMRLKVAKETASAITYLHTAFARPIIHRGIAPSNILIDKDSIPKLCNFDQAITIPEGETHVQVNIITGANFYLEHAYALSGIVTEHTDIYSFGVVLLFLISGKRPSSSSIHDDEQSFPNYVRNLFERERFMELVDPKILEEEGGINEEKEVQLQAFLKLAWICLKENGEDRPLMIDVAKELVKIERSAR